MSVDNVHDLLSNNILKQACNSLR